MSQLETNPLNNPTISETHVNQKMQVKPAAQVSNLLFGPQTRGLQDFTIPQLDLTNIADKNKYIGTFSWPISSNASWVNVQFNWNFIKTLAPIGLSWNSFSNFSHILISIKPTSNAFFKGLTILAWDPVPSTNYYTSVYSMPYGTVGAFQQQKVNISPKTSDEINMLIPVNYPFNMFKNNIGPTSDTFVYTYLNTYTFGFLRAHVVSTLETTSALTSLTYTMSGQLLDYRTAGTLIRTAQ